MQIDETSTLERLIKVQGRSGSGIERIFDMRFGNFIAAGLKLRIDRLE